MHTSVFSLNTMVDNELQQRLTCMLTLAAGVTRFTPTVVVEQSTEALSPIQAWLRITWSFN